MKNLDEIIEKGVYQKIIAYQIGFDNPAGDLVKGFNLIVACSDNYDYIPKYFNTLDDIAKYLENLGGHEFTVSNYKYF